ncbi:MAG: phage baseplate assembly protein V [Hyphomicrobiales bacterium]|nr:phage baseplate assembly protein V [Hyphomicrobiales bacterium]
MRGNQQHSAQFKSGLVTLLDPKKRRVRVRFEDEDGVQSFWLRCISRGSLGMRQTHMPAVGEQVACLIDWRGEDGVIIGSVYSDADASPTTAAEVDHVTYSDGTVHEHDPVARVNRQLMPGGTKVLGVGGGRLMFKDGAIVSSVPIVLGQVPDPPTRAG